VLLYEYLQSVAYIWECEIGHIVGHCVYITIVYEMSFVSQKLQNVQIYKYQQDAHVTEFILSDNCTTCFGRHYHPSSGAQNNCNYSIW